MVERELKIMGVFVAVLVAAAVGFALIGMKYGFGSSHDQGDDQTTATRNSTAISLSGRQLEGREDLQPADPIIHG